MEALEYTLHNGLLSTPKKLILDTQYIEFQMNNRVDGPFQRVSQAQFKDVKYLIEPIQVDMFYIGSRFCIDILYGDDKVLPIRFAQYHLRKRGYDKVYTDVSAFIGKHFLIPRVEAVLAIYEAEGRLEMSGLTINQDKIVFENSGQEIDWQDVSLKEYYRYFAIFDKKRPETHMRFSFNEWNAEILCHTMKTLIRHMQNVQEK